MTTETTTEMTGIQSMNLLSAKMELSRMAEQAERAAAKLRVMVAAIETSAPGLTADFGRGPTALEGVSIEQMARSMMREAATNTQQLNLGMVKGMAAVDRLGFDLATGGYGS
jgi:hypothetical protein